MGKVPLNVSFTQPIRGSENLTDPGNVGPSPVFGVRFKIRVSIGAQSGLSLGVRLGIGVGVDLGPAPDLIRNISGYFTREIKNNDESK